MKRPSILVVEDEEINFGVICALLNGQNYQFHYVPSGPMALKRLDGVKPDLILLDVMLPGMDGIEVCRRIRTLPQWTTVPIMMVTALNAKSDLAHCLSAGADDFISKPVDGVELKARVQSMLRIKQQYDKIQALTQVQAETITVLESTLDELRGNLAHCLSHELNTPLHGILGTMELLQGNLEHRDLAEVRDLLGWIDRSARRLENITKKFRIYTELELAASQPQPWPTTRATVCRTDLEILARTWAETYNRSEDLNLWIEEAEVNLGERYLSVLFQELVDNALKFSPLHTPIHIRTQIQNNHLMITVQDSGRGMTEAQIARVGAFMQFERKLYEQQGMGMGLKIVKKIVELAEGEFSIISVYQEGTTVELTLPIATP